MSFFNVLADATEHNSKLGGEAIDVAHRTHDDLLDAVGVRRILPAPVKSLTDGLFGANKTLVLGAGSKTAGMLRTIGGAFGARQGTAYRSPEYESHSNKDNNQEGYSEDDQADGNNNEEDGDDNAEDDDNNEEDNDEDDDDDDDDEEGGSAPAGASPPPRHLATYPDRPDSRDHHFEYNPEHVPSHRIDLRHLCPPVYNQGDMMSCTSHAVAGAFEFSVMQQGLPEFSPSRLFIWYNGRARSGKPDAVKKNIGLSLRNAIQSVAPKSNGVCSEYDWSYEIGKYNKKTAYFAKDAKATQKPPVLATKHAHDHTAVTYKRFPAKDHNLLCKQLMQCLDNGIPFVFGMHHCDILKTDVVRATGKGIKKPTTKQLKDNSQDHSLMAVGYIKEEEVFIIRNSWGANWGEKGYFYMPFNLLNHCYDFWSIKVYIGRK